MIRRQKKWRFWNR